MALRSLFPGLQPEEQATVSNENFRDIDNRFRTNIVRNTTGKPRIQTGNIGENRYGQLLYDNDGVPIIIIGDLPDGSVGIVMAKPGENVIDAFS